MSFGYRDEDWVNPDDCIYCEDCPEWHPCPDGCDWGWCQENCEFTRSTTYCA